MMRGALHPIVACLALCCACAGTPRGEGASLAGLEILPLAERARIRDDWLAERLETVVPEIMRRVGVDLWLVIGREYNEDPVLETMLPATWLSARRRTILAFHDPGPGRGEVQRFAVARYDIGRFFEGIWDPDEEPDQWRRLARLIEETSARTVAINVSPDFALADGLSSSEHQALLASLPPGVELRATHELALGWLEARTASEMQRYPEVMSVAHAILAKGLSRRAITPGETTTEELAWWFREEVSGLGLDTWFHPSVSIQRAGQGKQGSFAARDADQTIRPGDLVHVDFGIRYLGLHTDTQQHAYVLREGEVEAPEELRGALAVGNRLQDILTGEFRSGRTGNEILSAALAQARTEAIDATIYTHPLGFHGHGAGPTIGLWDRQEGVPGAGDYPLYPRTCYSIELNAAVDVPSWGTEVRIQLEEDAFFDGREVRYLDGRQTELLLVRQEP